VASLVLAGVAVEIRTADAGGGDLEQYLVGARLGVGPVLDTDLVEVTGSQIDFGGSLWGINSPIGPGTMTWRVVDGFYTPHLVGTLHLDGANGMYGRMHVSHWDGGGNLISTQHGGIVRASGMGHQSWPVDLTPQNLSQIVEAHVCTELSNDGVNFWQVACESYILN